jgi:hypothetical protein
MKSFINILFLFVLLVSGISFAQVPNPANIDSPITSGTISISADTSFACFNITWTAPNTDNWYVVARIKTIEAY